MSQMDLAGAIHASIRAQGTVATVAVGGFKFPCAGACRRRGQLLYPADPHRHHLAVGQGRSLGPPRRRRHPDPRHLGVYHFVAVKADYRPLPPESEALLA